jgi:anti-anti-sigma regulatory factor
VVQAWDGLLLVEFYDCLRLDPAPLRELRAAYEDHLRGGGRAQVVIDLSGVDFAGSAVLGGFVNLRRMGARVVFYHVDPNLQEIFRLSKLEPLFQFAATREEAIERVRDEGLSTGPAAAQPGSAPRIPPQPGPLSMRLRRPGSGPTG